ncbi:hypothetical protein pb186bvf_002619 [Paramecium bursaria]
MQQKLVYIIQKVKSDLIYKSFLNHPAAQVVNEEITEDELVQKVQSNENIYGIILSKDSILDSIIFNKKQNIRAALCYNQYMAKFCREHNNANILIIPLDQISEEVASTFANDYLTTDLDILTTQNHKRRVGMLQLHGY